MYVPARSIITYQFKATTSLSLSSGTAIEQAVANDLHSAGFTIQDYHVDDSLVSIIAAGGWGYTVQITMKIKTGGIDYSDESDVQAIFDHYVLQETGSLPASIIQNVQTPTATAPVATGDTQQTPSQTDNSGGGNNSASSWFDSITKFLEGAGTGAILGVGLAIVAVVLLAGWAQSRKLI